MTSPKIPLKVVIAPAIGVWREATRRGALSTDASDRR